MIHTFKSSDESQRKMRERVQSFKLEQCNIYEAAFYGGNVTHQKWVAASEEYSVKRARANFKCNVIWLIRITGILTFKLFEGGFNRVKLLIF